MSLSQFALRTWAPAGAVVLGLAAFGSAQAASLTEGFGVAPPVGWTTINNSAGAGVTGWFQGNTTVFSAQAGPDDSYVGANFNSTTGESTISNWLISPTLSFNNGDTVSFYTRTTDGSTYPDRLELRFSNVGGTNVGTTPTSVGSFALLLSVNPTLGGSIYPEEWTQYSATISGLTGATNGAIAFRYFVTEGGPLGINSNYIGIDTLSITPVPEPAAWLLMGLGLGAFALRRAKLAQA